MAVGDSQLGVAHIFVFHKLDKVGKWNLLPTGRAQL
jgi:hypothetical protein